MPRKFTQASAQRELDSLNAEIDAELDFAFSYLQESELLILRTALGLARRLLLKRSMFGKTKVEVFPVPLRREPRPIGLMIYREIAGPVNVEVEAFERAGYTIARFKNFGRAELDRVVESCLTTVKTKLVDYRQKYSNQAF